MSSSSSGLMSDASGTTDHKPQMRNGSTRPTRPNNAKRQSPSSLQRQPTRFTTTTMGSGEHNSMTSPRGPSRPRKYPVGYKPPKSDRPVGRPSKSTSMTEPREQPRSSNHMPKVVPQQRHDPYTLHTQPDPLHMAVQPRSRPSAPINKAFVPRAPTVDWQELSRNRTTVSAFANKKRKLGESDSPPNSNLIEKDAAVSPIIAALPKDFCKTNEFLTPLDVTTLTEEHCKNCGDTTHPTIECKKECGKCGKNDHRHTGDTEGVGACPNLEHACPCKHFPGHIKKDYKEECSCPSYVSGSHTIWKCIRRCCKCGSFEHIADKCNIVEGCPCEQGKHFGYKHGGGCMVIGCGKYICTEHCDTCGMVKSSHLHGECTLIVKNNWFKPEPSNVRSRASEWRVLECVKYKHKHSFGQVRVGSCSQCPEEDRKRFEKKCNRIRHLAMGEEGWEKRLKVLLDTYGCGDWVTFVQWYEDNGEEAEKLIKSHPILRFCKVHASTAYDLHNPHGCPQCYADRLGKERMDFDQFKQLVADHRKWQQQMDSRVETYGTGDRQTYLRSIEESGREGKELVESLYSDFRRNPQQPQ